MNVDFELRITMPSRCGTAGRSKKRACLGLPDAFALEHEQGNHTPSPGAKLRQGDGLLGSVQWCRECEPVSRTFAYTGTSGHETGGIRTPCRLT